VTEKGREMETVTERAMDWERALARRQEQEAGAGKDRRQ
jgi:hypothetical protein